MKDFKTQVRDFWQRQPCGVKDVSLTEGSKEFFDEVERQRFEGDDFMRAIAGFNGWTGKRVLEVGCGLGTDLLQFARSGALISAVDLTEPAARLASRRLRLYGFRGLVASADAEHLPFPSEHFDLVYSWGVIHHTASPETAVREILRVCRPGGSILVMIYHRRSLFALQAWLVYGLFQGRPRRPLNQIIAEHLESPGTRAYTLGEARELFHGLNGLRCRTIVTRYDLRVGRRAFLPRWTRKLFPARVGWFLVVQGKKPVDEQPAEHRGAAVRTQRDDVCAY